MKRLLLIAALLALAVPCRAQGHADIVALEKSKLLAQYIPERYLRLYGQVKRGEYGELLENVFNREYDFYA